jgi:hypothetical protein
LVFHESLCLLTFLSWGFFPKRWGCKILVRFCCLNKIRTYVHETSPNNTFHHIKYIPFLGHICVGGE